MAHPGVATFTTNNSGSGTVSIQHNLQNVIWEISQISVSTGGVMTVWLSYNGVPCTSAVTATSPITASGTPTIDIGGHDTLTVNVSNAKPTQVVTVTYYYLERYV